MFVKTQLQLEIDLKKTGLLLLLIAASLFSFAQQPEEDSIDLLLDELFFNEEHFISDILGDFDKRSFIYTNLSYNSNTYFSGRDSGIDQFNLIPQISFNHSSGMNLSLSGMYYEIFDPNWDFSTVSLSYYSTIGRKKNYYFNTGYTKYFYNDGWDIFTNSLDASIGFKNKKRNFGSTLTMNYLFGSDQSFQLSTNSYFKQSLLSRKKYGIQCKPNLSLLIAKQTIALEQLNTQGEENTSEIIYYDIFNLLNTQLVVPLSITTRTWDASLSYVVNIPTPVASETESNPTHYLKITVGYLIDFKKKKQNQLKSL